LFLLQKSKKSILHLTFYNINQARPTDRTDITGIGERISTGIHKQNEENNERRYHRSKPQQLDVVLLNILPIGKFNCNVNGSAN